MEKNDVEKYLRAKKKVDRIKGFYSHLNIYIVANILLFVGKGYAFGYLASHDMATGALQEWLNINVILTPLLWGIGLLIHGLMVFKFESISIGKQWAKWTKDWEDRQIKKYMENDKD